MRFLFYYTWGLLIFPTLKKFKINYIIQKGTKIKYDRYRLQI